MVERDYISENYSRLVEQFGRLHENGFPELGISPDKVYTGLGIIKHIDRIKSLIREKSVNSILEYGSGKGVQYKIPLVDIGLDDKEFLIDYWDVIGVECYDPGFKEFSTLPNGVFDAVISINVLECVFEDDVNWVLEEIFSKATSFVYLSIGCFPAKKKLPSGENTNITVREPEWWVKKIKEATKQFPLLYWEAHFSRFLKKGASNQEVIERLIVSSN